MKYLPPRPLSRLDGGSASAMFRIRMTSWKKQRRVQLRAQRQTLPKRGRAPDARKPPKTPRSPAVFQRAAERATRDAQAQPLHAVRRSQSQGQLSVGWPEAGSRRGSRRAEVPAAGAEATDEAERHSRPWAALAPVFPPLRQHPQPAPQLRHLSWSSSFPSPPATAGLASAQDSSTGDLTSV